MHKSTSNTGTTGSFEPFNLEAVLFCDAVRKALVSLPRLPQHGVPKFIGYRREQEQDEIAQLQTTFMAQQAALRQTPPSRPVLCANFILSAVYMPLIHGALGAYTHNNAYEFIVFFDYASGIAEIAGELKKAAAENAGIGDRFTKQGIAMAVEEYAQPVPSSFYETAYALNREMDKRAGQLLQKDPTGKTLIAAIVAEIRAEVDHPPTTEGIHRILAYQEPQLFLAGAEYAQRIYTVLYPLSQ